MQKIKFFLHSIIAGALLFTSCKQVKYQEFGSFGGGKFSLNNSAATNNKAVTSVELGSKQTTEIEDYNFPTNASNTKIAGIANLKNPASSAKVAHEKSRISINQVFKAIHKIKSTPKKQLLKEIKNQKQIFGYEGENGAMTLGFNILIYSLISLASGIFLLLILQDLAGLFAGFGFLGSIFGGLLWVCGWLYDLSYTNGGYLLWIFLGMIVLGLLILSAFAI